MAKFSRNLQGVLFGILTVVAVLAIFDVVLTTYISPIGIFLFFWNWLSPIFIIGIASFAGAVVARTAFVWPAALLAIGMWGLSMYMLNSFAESAGQGDMAETMALHINGAISSISGAIIGANLGIRFCK